MTEPHGIDVVELVSLRRHLDSCIWIDPGRQSGAPCFGGTRIPLPAVLSLPDAAVHDWYPGVTVQHLATARWFAEQPGAERFLREWR